MNLSYKIPESKRDITVYQFIAIEKLKDFARENDTNINNDELLSACLSIPLEYVSKLPKADYDEALEGVRKALKDESKMYLTFDYNGVKYGFIPDLENITIGEYSALEKLMVKADENANEILNVLYRPITKEKFYTRFVARAKHDIKHGKEDRLKRGEKYCKEKQGKYLVEAWDAERHNTDFSGLTCEILESSLVFFYSLGNALLVSILKYTAEAVEGMKEAQDLGKNGDGIRRLIHTLRQKELIPTTYTKKLQVKYFLD